MTPIVAHQRSIGMHPRLIKLFAEIRAAGFDKGNFRWNRGIANSGEFHLRPSLKPVDLHATVTMLRNRGLKFDEWCQDLVRRYETLLENRWNKR